MVTPIEIEQFIDRLIKLTQQELDYESLSTPTASLSSSLLSSLSKSGQALLNLSSTSTEIGLGGKTILQLERSIAYHNTVVFPPHDFRPGDVASVLDMGKVGSGGAGGEKGQKGKEKEEGIEGVVYKVLDNKVLIAVGKGGRADDGDKNKKGSSTSDDDMEIPTRIALIKVSNPTTYLRQIQALEKLKKIVLPPSSHPILATTTALDTTQSNSEAISPPTEGDISNATATLTLASDSDSDSDSNPDPSPPPPAPATDPPLSSSPPLSPLISLLLGLTSLPPPLSPSSPPSPQTTYFNPSLNPSQKSTIQFILHSPSPIGLIWGPPGTGKTSTVVEIIRQLVLKEGKRVLVCGGSNLSVDGILEKLMMRPLSFVGRMGEGVEELERISVTRIGHPARVLSHLTKHTLDSQSIQSETSSILNDIKMDLKTLEGKLNGGVSGVKKENWRGRKVERRKMWEEVRELRKDFRRREKGVIGGVLEKAKVVLCTTHGAGSRLLDKEEPFDVVIIDEAAQVTEPSCWIPILKGKKLILAGDHLQLPPTIKSLNSGSKEKNERSKVTEKKSNSPKDSKDADEESKDDATSPISPTPSLKLTPSPSLELTLFSRLLSLHGPSIRRMLNVQYRFNEKIMEFPSKILYDGELKADESVSGRTLVDLIQLSEEEEGKGNREVDEDLKEEVIFYDTAGAGMYERLAGDDTKGPSGGDGSKSNENEANLVLKHIDSLIQAGLPRTAIAVISPYNAQVSLIASLVHPTYPEIEVGSIDSWQGREQEVVIISLVRSNEKGEVGFLREKRRLNVAMTRPKRQLVVIGDSHTVKQGGSYLKNWMEWLEENAYVVPVS